VLELDEPGGPVFLTQSVAIIEYLEERFPEPPLLPREPLARASVRELTELINSGIQPFQNLSTTAYLAEIAPGVDKQRWYDRFVAQGLATLESRATRVSGRFLVGDDVSIADVLLVPQLYAARRVGVDFKSLPTLLRVEAECSKLAGFATAHPDRQADRE
jgi:maleylpyruvate isomerase